MPDPKFAELVLYSDTEELKQRVAGRSKETEVMILGSYVHDGIAIGDWLTKSFASWKSLFYYDIDTPVTLKALEGGSCEYLSPELVPRFDAYLSFSGGIALERLQEKFGAQNAVAFHCSADPDLYYPEPKEKHLSLGYLGTYSRDRQPPLERLLIEPARRLPSERFQVVGPQYPADIQWPENVERSDHLPPHLHREFYNSQRFTLNVTRADMVELGHSPSVRLFEAAACGVPVISDRWEGIGDYFEPGREILLADSSDQVIEYLQEFSEADRVELGERARKRFLAEHAPEKRAEQLENLAASNAVKG
ncbi:glycosyltransferase [Pelagicoccus sp. SDUM812002]|uniref:CgeB family protein n=1 Tax=Pelagicoccus sp. SDUM812002 TaxID=3041266 RepID=UPI002811E651|nr:glycosyltransferase [Pelagicoccus sp. SDUM812002]